jgi:hypothetical protein
MENGDNDDIPDDLVDNVYDDIIRCRTIARRTKWRLRFTFLSQREVALAASIASSLSDYIQLINAVLNGSTCNSMFSTEPPSLQDYLPLDEPIHHYIPNDAIVYNYYILD